MIGYFELILSQILTNISVKHESRHLINKKIILQTADEAKFAAVKSRAQQNFKNIDKPNNLAKPA